MPGSLSVVPTPIGNLGDITLRAIAALRAADLIAAEDTRRTGILCRHHAIAAPLISFHEHNEAARTAELVGRIAAGSHLALVTDAGTPAIADPGFRLIRACHQNGFPVTVLPGPSAVLVALVGSGFPPCPFYFAGFLPPKSGKRCQAIAAAGGRAATTVFFESPHRLVKTLEDCARLLPDRPLCVARELTKVHEEFRTGPPADLLAHYRARPPRGEICLLVRGGDAG